MKKYLILISTGVIIGFGFFLYYHPLIWGSIKADINGGYDVKGDIYYQNKSDKVEVVSNTGIAGDKMTFVVIFNPDRVKVDMGNLKYNNISSNIYKVNIDGPIKFDRFDKITSIGYKGDRDKVNISDVTIYNGSDQYTLSITNIP